MNIKIIKITERIPSENNEDSISIECNLVDELDTVIEQYYKNTIKLPSNMTDYEVIMFMRQGELAQYYQ